MRGVCVYVCTFITMRVADIEKGEFDSSGAEKWKTFYT
jgi:hypothetical protein